MTSWALRIRVRLHIWAWEFRQIFNQKVNTLAPISCLRGKHQWRYFAHPFGKQCKIPACGVVEMMGGEIPAGMEDYVSHYTDELKCRSVIQPPRVHAGCWTQPDSVLALSKEAPYECWCGQIHTACPRCERIIPGEATECPYCLFAFVIQALDPSGPDQF